jgi:hypothetical protein
MLLLYTGFCEFSARMSRKNELPQGPIFPEWPCNFVMVPYEKTHRIRSMFAPSQWIPHADSYVITQYQLDWLCSEM